MAIPRFKEGIPLLETFEDDDEGPWVEERTAGGTTSSRVKLALVIAACVLGALLLAGLVIGLAVGIVMGTSSGRRNEVAVSYVIHTDSVPWSDSYLPLTLSELIGTSQLVPPTTVDDTMQSSQLVVPSSAQTFAVITTPQPSLTEVPSPTLGVPSLTSEVPSPTLGVPSLTSEVPSPTPGVPSLASEEPSPTPMEPSSTAEVPSLTPEVPTSSPSTVVTTPDAQLPLSPSPPAPHRQLACRCQSPRDPRTYDVLSLPNGLRALLISDPDTNVSAASMDVATGSFDDPRGAQGLAHFCEHMLFLGTSKYPREGEYSEYLSSHGGHDNAFTSTQETNYYFAVDSGYLEGALDRFAQFFVSPLFRSDAVSREIHAVNAEHEKNRQSDDRRVWQLLKHVSNPEHPFSMFATGSLQTLNQSDILQTLVESYHRHYSANQMQLVVYGREPAPLLSSWIDTYFSDIKTTPTATPTTFNTTSFPSPHFTRTLIYFRPVADIPRLLLIWQTPPMQPDYRAGVASLVCGLLGSDSAGGLSDTLKQRGWVTRLEAGILLDTDSYSLFRVTVDLTASGLAHASEVVGGVFKYVRLLAMLDGDRVERLWNDSVNIAQIKFDYSPKTKPINYVVNIAKQMRLVKEPEDFLGNPRRLLFNATLLTQTISWLVPNNTILLVGAQTLDTGGNTSATPSHQLGQHPLPWPALSQVEPVYGIHYEKIPIPGHLLEFWESDSSDVSFQLPGPNPFVPSDFSILPTSENVSAVPVMVVGKEEEEKEPAQPSTTLWWLQDTEFREPRVNLHCNIWTNTREVSPRWTALTALYTILVKTVLVPYTYAASLTEHTFALDHTPLGLHLHFRLFSDSSVAGGFVEMVVEALSNTSLLNNDVAFSLSKEALVQNLSNYNYTQLPYIYTIRHIQRVIMERPHWENWQLLQEVQRTTLKDLLDHVTNSLLQDISLLCFAHGNLNRQQAQQYYRVVATLPVSWANMTTKGQPTTIEVRLSPGNYSVAIAALNPEDRNSVVNVIYQSDSLCAVDGKNRCTEASLITRAHLGLLEQMIADACFQQLRTVEQLGYVVKCFGAVHETSGSLQTLVQSIDYTPQRVLGSIDSFLHSFLDTHLLNISSDGDTFSLQVNVLRAKLLRRDLTIDEKTNRLWTQINTGMEQFDWNQQTVDVLARLSPSSLVEFYRQLVTDASRYRKMAIVVYGRGRDSNLSTFNFTYPLDYARLDQNRTTLP